LPFIIAYQLSPFHKRQKNFKKKIQKKLQKRESAESQTIRQPRAAPFDKTMVTRFGEILAHCFLWAFFLITERDKCFWATFFLGNKLWSCFDTKKGLGFSLGDFFTQTHLVTLAITATRGSFEPFIAF
jgi:hypothetical protein